MTMLHYLSSPYNHPDPTVMAQRRDAACRKAGELIAAGMAVLSPIAHNVAIIEATGAGTGWAQWMQQDLAMLAACDKLLVYRLPGWDVSRGVAAEIDAAIRQGKQIEYID